MPAGKRRKSARRARARRAIREVQKWSGGKKLAALLLGLLVVVLGYSAWLASPGFFGLRAVTVPLANSNSPEALHIIDVGQGLAVLLECDGEFALIDGGTPEAGDDLVNYLKAAGVERLEYLVMTHPHADHIGGMERVLREFAVGQFILPNFELAPYPTTSIFESLMKYALERQIPSVTGREQDTYPLGRAALEIVHGGLATDDNYNLLSLAVRYKGPQMTVLCTGDGEKTNERAMAQGNLGLQADIYVAGHHGSSTSNTQELLQRVWPKYGVVSCGWGNAYGHPHRETLGNFEAMRMAVYRTDELGSIVFKPAGGGAYAIGWSNEAAAAAA